MLGRDLLYLPCRHHIFEIVLGGVFDSLMPTASTGPSIALFQRFQKEWQSIDQNKFKVGLEDEKILTVFENHIDRIHLFCEKVLNSQIQPRDDYRELLLLSLIFIGKIPREKVKFFKPGSVSRARWMAKAIYCLKLFLFRDVFRLTAPEMSAIREICAFVLIVYLEAWFEAPFANSAPNNDLNFVKKLHDFGKINFSVSKVAMKKMSNHLWYLGPESAAMAFFDEKVSDDMKRKMVFNIQNNLISEDIENKLPKRYDVSQTKNLNLLLDKNIDFFVTSESMAFFERFEINCSLFDEDPSKWISNQDYKFGMELVKTLSVVNDVAERGVKLIAEYVRRRTKAIHYPSTRRIKKKIS